MKTALNSVLTLQEIHGAMFEDEPKSRRQVITDTCGNIRDGIFNCGCLYIQKGGG